MNAISSYEKPYKESSTDVVCGEICRHDNGVITYKCSYCQLKFSSGIDFESHIVDHFLILTDETDAVDDLASRLCDVEESISADCLPMLQDEEAATEDECATTDTLLINDTSGAITCPCCSMRFACQGLRDQHIFKKTVAYTKCPLCPAYFRDRLQRMHHKVLHHLPDDKQYRCVRCSRPFDTQTDLIDHITKDEPPPALNDSLPPLQYLPSLHAPPKPIYECDICGGTFMSKVRLEKHLDNHVSVKLDCDTCGRHFKTIDVLRRHMYSHASHKAFQCNHCDKAYMHMSSLQEHQKLHTGQRNFICHQCGKTYANSHTFSKHLREFHERIKHFVCTDCGDAFFTVHLLNDHVRAQHTLERPYACKSCAKTFTSAKLLAAHAGSHGGSQYQCRHCQRMFNHRTNRWVHEKRKHLHFID